MAKVIVVQDDTYVDLMDIKQKHLKETKKILSLNDAVKEGVKAWKENQTKNKK